MVNVFDASSLSSKDMRQWLRYNQIAHYLMSRSDFEIKIVRKIKCLICISKGSLLLKHPVVQNQPVILDTELSLAVQ